MKIEYRRLTEKEITIFIGMRIQQLREEGAKEEIDLVSCIERVLYASYGRWYICILAGLGWRKYNWN